MNNLCSIASADSYCSQKKRWHGTSISSVRSLEQELEGGVAVYRLSVSREQDAKLYVRNSLPFILKKTSFMLTRPGSDVT